MFSRCVKLTSFIRSYTIIIIGILQVIKSVWIQLIIEFGYMYVRCVVLVPLPIHQN